MYSVELEALLSRTAMVIREDTMGDEQGNTVPGLQVRRKPLNSAGGESERTTTRGARYNIVRCYMTYTLILGDNTVNPRMRINDKWRRKWKPLLGPNIFLLRLPCVSSGHQGTRGRW